MKRPIKPREQANYSVRVLFSQKGQSMVEMLVILPSMLLLIFGTIQFALIYHAKITLNYAAFEAVRAGTLNCDKKYKDYNNKCTSEVGQFDAVKEGFARGLAPLYSYYEPNAKKRGTMIDPASGLIHAYQQGRDRIFDEFDSQDKLIRIERLNPTDKAFSDFASDSVIPNNNLMYRSSDKGSNSKMPIQNANLLHLRITYWYPLYVPLLNNLIFDKFICCKKKGNSYFFGWITDYSDSTSICNWASDPVCQNDEPRIPLTVTAVMRMQAPVENSSEYYIP